MERERHSGGGSDGSRERNGGGSSGGLRGHAGGIPILILCQGISVSAPDSRRRARQYR